MRRFLQISMLMFCVLVAGVAAHAQTSDADVRALLKSMKVDEQYKQLQVALTQQIKPALEGISRSLPEQTRTRFAEAMDQQLAELAKADPSELMEETVKVYGKHYSADEIKGLRAFYESPLGKKMLEATPLITTELMGTGMKWNQTQANKVLQNLLNQFPELNALLGQGAQAQPAPMEHMHE